MAQAVLISTYVSGSGVTYGSSGFCNFAIGEIYFLTNASGSGGPSGCATGIPTAGGVVGGTCKGYAKPSWQSGLLGNPGDGVLDLPDVSLFASNGLWGHYYVDCDSDTGETEGRTAAERPATGQVPEAHPLRRPPGPAFRPCQKTAEKQGNPNPTNWLKRCPALAATNPAIPRRVRPSPARAFLRCDAGRHGRQLHWKPQLLSAIRLDWRPL